MVRSKALHARENNRKPRDSTFATPTPAREIFFKTVYFKVSFMTSWLLSLLEYFLFWHGKNILIIIMPSNLKTKFLLSFETVCVSSNDTYWTKHVNGQFH